MNSAASSGIVWSGLKTIKVEPPYNSSIPPAVTQLGSGAGQRYVQILTLLLQELLLCVPHPLLIKLHWPLRTLSTFQSSDTS